MNWQTVGFEKNKLFFEKAITHGHLNHAYLFTGQEMVGKKTFAFELARFINKIPNDSVSHSLFYLDPQTSESGLTISIGGIREIKSFLSFSAGAGIYKLIIINDAHCLTDEAQNALLKILEEPSASSIFILISDRPSLLLPTVTSRCQEIKFQPHSQKIITDFLNKLKLNQPKADFLIKFCNGRIGLAKNIVDNNSFDEVKKMVEEFTYLAKADINSRFITAQKMSDDKQKNTLSKKILYWLLYLKSKSYEPKTARVLRNLLILHQKIQQPQLNTRLALEEFLVKL